MRSALALLALLLAVAPTLRAGGDHVSTGTTQVLHGGRVVANTLDPLDPALPLSVTLEAGWWVSDLKTHVRVGLRLDCPGGAPPDPARYRFTLGPWSFGDRRAVAVRVPGRADHEVHPARVRSAPGSDLHVLAGTGADETLALARLALQPGALIHDGVTRIVVSDAPERLQGARALMERCMRPLLGDPGWYAPPPDTSRLHSAPPQVLRAIAWRARVDALLACGDRLPSPVLLPPSGSLSAAGRHHGLLLQRADPPAWEWLALRDWYGRAGAACLPGS